MISLYAKLGAVVFALLLLFGAYAKGRNDNETKWKLEIAKQVEQARIKEQDLQRKADDNAKQALKDKELIQSRLTIALNSLRDRPDRMPESARANCAGSSGKELSAVDGVFLRRYATTHAETCWNALEGCYRHLDLIK